MIRNWRPRALPFRCVWHAVQRLRHRSIQLAADLCFKACLCGRRRSAVATLFSGPAGAASAAADRRYLFAILTRRPARLEAPICQFRFCRDARKYLVSRWMVEWSSNASAPLSLFQGFDAAAPLCSNVWSLAPDRCRMLRAQDAMWNMADVKNGTMPMRCASRFGKPKIVHATEARAIVKIRRYWRKYGVVLRRYYCSRVASHPESCVASSAAEDFVTVAGTNALESNTRVDPAICAFLQCDGARSSNRRRTSTEDRVGLVTSPRFFTTVAART
jgi:hypothetical protein